MGIAARTTPEVGATRAGTGPGRALAPPAHPSPDTRELTEGDTAREEMQSFVDKYARLKELRPVVRVMRKALVSDSNAQASPSRCLTHV
jgi:hypothetical protein